MTIPPTTINRYINHTEVLHALGVEVKRNLPTIADCPVCYARMSISKDEDKGAWYACSGCGFAGDSIELYHRARDMDSMSDAVYAMMQSDLPTPGMDKLRIKQYLNTVWPKRNNCSKFWSHACTNLEKLSSRAGDLLNRYRLYSGHPVYGSEVMGFTTKADGPEYSLGDNFTMKSTGLVVSFQDQPHRHRGFYLLTAQGRKYAKLYNAPDLGADDGLAFLDQVEGNVPCVYAMSDVLTGLMLHIKHEMGGIGRLPLVAWRPGTTNAWQSLSTGKVLLWAPEVTRTVIDTARRAQVGKTKVFIAREPVLTDMDDPGKLYAQINAIGISKFMGMMHASEQPLIEALKDYRAETDDDLLLLDLDGPEIHALRNISTPSEQKQLDAEIQRNKGVRQANCSGKPIEEREDGWYYVKKDKEYRICNVKIVLERVIRFARAKKTMCSGQLIVGGHEVHFEAEARQIQQHAAEWLEATVLEAGIEVLPVVATSWSNKLWNIAAEMYHPQVTTIEEYVGWSATQDWWAFPRFNITASKIELVDTPPEGLASVPCMKLLPPKTMAAKTLRPLTTDTEPNRVCWAVLTGIIHNLLAPVAKWDMCSIGLVAEPEVGHGILTWLKDELNLPVQKLTERGSVVDTAAEQGIASIVTLTPQQLVYVRTWVIANISANIIIPVSPIMSDVGELYSNWMMVSGGNDLDPATLAGAGDVIPAFLHWLYRNGHKIPAGNSVKAVVTMLQAWVLEIVGKPRPALTNMYQVMVHAGLEDGYSPAKTLARVLMQLVWQPIFTERARKQLLHVDEKTGDVRLAVNSIVDALKRYGYPTPSTTTIMDTLISSKAIKTVENRTSNVVILHKKWWNDCTSVKLTPAKG